MFNYYYTPKTRRPSASIASPTSPHLSSALAESPRAMNTPGAFPGLDPSPPQTPKHKDSLGPFQEDSRPGTGTTPLVSRDYARKPAPPFENTNDSFSSFANLDEPSYTPVPALTLQSPPPVKSKPIDPDLIPPPSVHDAYLSNLITPLTAEKERPSIIRATSEPGVTATSTLLPSAELDIQASNSNSNLTGDINLDGKPIFEIFDAELNTGAEEMVKVLKGHLSGVLKMQEEIGRMHLGLEALDLDGEIPEDAGAGRGLDEGLGKREKAVDEIMERVRNHTLFLMVFAELFPSLER